MDDITTKHGAHEPVDPDENPSTAYERTDTDTYTVSKWAIALSIGIVIAAFSMWGLFEWFQNHTEVKEEPVSAAVLSERPKMPPRPNLQFHPKVELREFKQAEDEWLHGYGWLDTEKGIVNIPIEQAIDAVVKKGLPSKPAKDAGIDDQGYRLLPEKSSSGRTLEKIAQ